MARRRHLNGEAAVVAAAVAAAAAGAAAVEVTALVTAIRYVPMRGSVAAASLSPERATLPAVVMTWRWYPSGLLARRY